MNKLKEINNLIKYFKQQNKKVLPDTELFKSGLLDSIDMIDLVMYLEEEYEIKIPETSLKLENFNTVKNISNIIYDLKK